MVLRLSKTVGRVSLVAFLVLTGCIQKIDDIPESVNPLGDPNVVVPDYVTRAMVATGGADAWAGTGLIEADCVVTFYQPSLYLTKQHVSVRPWPAYIRIEAREPQGEFVWELSGDGFSVRDGSAAVDVSPISAVDRRFAASVLYVMTAPMRLLDEAGRLTRNAEPVKIQGRWYHSIEKVTADDAPELWSKVVFYQNAQSSLVDMIWISGTPVLPVAGNEKTHAQALPKDGVSPAHVSEPGLLAVRGYDYARLERGKVLVPRRVEIFGADASGTLNQRLAKIDYYNLHSTQKVVSD